MKIPAYISKGRLLICDNCREVSEMPRDLPKELLPYTVQCVHCQGYYTLTTTVLPKITPPATIVQAFKEVDQHPSSGHTIQERKELLEQQNSENPATKLPFYSTCMALGSLSSQIFRGIHAVRQELRDFENTVANYFTQEWRYFARFSEKWDHRYINKFIDFPFTAFPVICEDEASAQYSRYVLAPRFFNPCFGFKIPHTFGGLRLELINQYSLMNFPLEIDLRDEFDIPQGLDLQVRGNKIVGSSLELCYRDIPGIAFDSDHSTEWASVYIQNSVLARQWLAAHGILPWDKNPIQQKDLNFFEDELPNSFNTDPVFADAWKRFRETGRLGVFMSDPMMGRRFAVLCGLTLKGVTAVFVSGHKERVAWDSLYSLSNYPSEITKGHQCVFFKNGDAVAWEPVLRSTSIIVDLYGKVDTEILNRLYNYTGRLIVISPDPMMDFNSINITAKRVHGLCGYEFFEPPVWENPLRENEKVQQGVERVWFGATLSTLEKTVRSFNRPDII